MKKDKRVKKKGKRIMKGTGNDQNDDHPERQNGS